MRKQDDLGRRLIVVSNLKTFIGHRIFQSDVVPQNLATVSVLEIYLQKRQVFFDVLKK